MTKTIMIFGASGNFGSKIALGLARANAPLILVGRNIQRLQLLQHNIEQQHPNCTIQTAVADINKDITENLSKFKPFLVINACGPFQAHDYKVAIASTNLGINYIDLADNRKFVCGFTGVLDNLAKQNGCVAISGASTVPCLSSAVLAHYKNELNIINSLVFGISPGQKTTRGLATTASVLSYVGKRLDPYLGATDKIYGWQDLYLQTYPIIGKRWMANCDIPDLDLLPQHFGIKSIKFSAGMESTTLHFGIWILSWIVRMSLPLNLANYSKFLLKLSHLFDYFGSDAGGMHMIINGKDKKGNQKTIKWFIIAKEGHGAHIPTIPSIILAKKLTKGTLKVKGAMTSINLVTLEEYLDELRGFNIITYAS